MRTWKNKVTIVCGGSSGLGLCIAQQLVHQHAKAIVLVARDEVKLREAVDSLMASAHDCQSESLIDWIAADLTNLDSVRACEERLRQQFGAIDLMVQTVGISARGSLQQLTRERLQSMVDANVVTSLHAIQCFNALLSANKGSIILVGSLACYFAPRFLSGYAIAKHGLAALAQQARLELASTGVHLLLGCPGPIRRTDAGSRYNYAAEANLTEQALQPGGGAKLKGLEADYVAKELLLAAAKRRAVLILPRHVWLLRIVTAVWQSLGDRILRNKSS